MLNWNVITGKSARSSRPSTSKNGKHSESPRKKKQMSGQSPRKHVGRCIKRYGLSFAFLRLEILWYSSFVASNNGYWGEGGGGEQWSWQSPAFHTPRGLFLEFFGIFLWPGVKTIKGTTTDNLLLLKKRSAIWPCRQASRYITTLTWMKSQNTVWLRTGGKQIEEDVIHLSWRPGIHKKQIHCNIHPGKFCKFFLFLGWY